MDVGAGEVVSYDFIYCKKTKQRECEGDTTAKNCMKIARTPSAMLSGRPAKGLCWGKGSFPPPTISSCPEPARSRPEPVVTALGQKHGWESASDTHRAPGAHPGSCVHLLQAGDTARGGGGGEVMGVQNHPVAPTVETAVGSPCSVTSPGLIMLHGGDHWGFFLHLCFLVHRHYQPVIFGSQRGNEQRPL